LFPKEAAVLTKLCDSVGQVLPHELVLNAAEGFGGFRRFRDALGGGAEGDLAVNNMVRFTETLIDLENQGHTCIETLLHQLGKLADEDEYGNASGHVGAVTLMTMHKGKGLEYPFVAVVETAGAWDKKDRYWAKGFGPNGESGVFYVGTKKEQPSGDAGFEQIQRQLEQELAAEAARLLYVALTRSRHHLLITAHGAPKEGQEVPGFFPHLRQSLVDCGGALTHLLGTAAAQLARGCSEAVMAGAATISQAMAESEVGGRSASVDAAPIQPGGRGGLRLSRPHESEPAALEPGLKLPASAGPWDEALPRSVYGTFIHRGLEATLAGYVWQPEVVWQQLLRSAQVPIGGGGGEAVARIYEKATAELSRALQDPHWRDLISSATAVRTEVPVFAVSGDQLMRGVIDLYLEHSDGAATVIDYKTIALPDSSSLEELGGVCRQLGFDRQIGAYVDALKRTEPRRVIRGCVYFTSLPKLVTISGG